MKNRRIIGVDFDDVIMSTNAAMRLYHNRTYGTNYELDDVVDWDLSSLWCCSREEVYRRYREFYDSPEHLLTEPVPGAITALTMLAESAELHIVTARPLEFEAVTRKLAEQHVSFIPHIHFINKVGVKDGHHRTKAEVCDELGVEVFIEDHFGYAEGIAALGIPVLLFSRPWNKKEKQLPQGMRRVDSWTEAMTVVL